MIVNPLEERRGRPSFSFQVSYDQPAIPLEDAWMMISKLVTQGMLLQGGDQGGVLEFAVGNHRVPLGE